MMVSFVLHDELIEREVGDLPVFVCFLHLGKQLLPAGYDSLRVVHVHENSSWLDGTRCGDDGVALLKRGEFHNNRSVALGRRCPGAVRSLDL